MPHQVDTEIDLTEQKVDSKYIISSQHRRKGNIHKCIWIISLDEEVNCFVQAIKENWKVGSQAWGLKIVNTVIQVVGHNSRNRELKLAKFIVGNDKDIWHGYPADYMMRAQDRPATDILKAWVNNGYISKAKMSKIRLGHSCNL